MSLVVRGAMLMTLVLLVFNKVGSPQYMTWLAAPVAVALVLGLPRWGTTAKWVLGVGAATRLVFPWEYTEITGGGLGVTLVLAARNVALIGLLVHTAREPVPRGDGRAGGAERACGPTACTGPRAGARDEPRARGRPAGRRGAGGGHDAEPSA